MLQAEHSDLGEIINVDTMEAELGLSSIEAGRLAVEKIKRLMNCGSNFVQETTLSGVKTLQTIKRAKRRHYYVRLYYVGLEKVEDSIARIHSRAENGGHSIPMEDVVRRFKRRYISLMRVLPFCDEVRFYDNCNGFVEVGRITDGQLIFKGGVTPQWLVKLSGYIQREQERTRRTAN